MAAPAGSGTVTTAPRATGSMRPVATTGSPSVRESDTRTSPPCAQRVERDDEISATTVADVEVRETYPKSSASARSRDNCPSSSATADGMAVAVAAAAAAAIASALGARYPLRALTDSPGRVTFTSILRYLPSFDWLVDEYPSR